MQDIPLRDAYPEDIAWLVARHGALYRAEAQFDNSFSPVIERALKNYFASRDPRRERAFVPVADDEPVGSLFLTCGPAKDVGQLRLFWLEPAHRGTGLAVWRLQESLATARAAGFREMLVRTYDRHVAAGKLYARAGFKMVKARAVTNFGQDLVEQAWRRPL
jgi:GNAT superfamily N-acetyltransferase